MSEVDKFLGDYGKRDSLGVQNGFRKLSELYISKLVDEGKWFTVCHKIGDKQVDIMKIKGNDDYTLGQAISNTFEEGGYRTSIYKYLMMNYLCYLEVPVVSFKTDTGTYRNTFDKMLVTSNVEVVADWLGVTVDDLLPKYKSRLFGIDFDDGDDELPYVKLTETKEGIRKAVCPRKNIDVSLKGTRVIPLFMLKTGVTTLYNKMCEDVIKVSFLKDNGQVRDIFTTSNEGKIKEIYGEGTFYGSAINLGFNGNFMENSAISRGYIRVVEIGGSRYDTATRSINYARIIDIDYEEEPDLSFINIDLGVVLDSFQDCVQKHQSKAEEIIDMLEAFDIDGGYWKAKDGETVSTKQKDIATLLIWSEERSMLLSTVFLREICLFMLSNPQWFSDFTGKPRELDLGSVGNLGFL